MVSQICAGSGKPHKAGPQALLAKAAPGSRRGAEKPARGAELLPRLLPGSRPTGGCGAAAGAYLTGKRLVYQMVLDVDEDLAAGHLSAAPVERRLAALLVDSLHVLRHQRPADLQAVQLSSVVYAGTPPPATGGAA